MLPFYFIKKIPPLRKKLLLMYQDRANQIVPRFGRFILKKDNILDIGCGTGAIAKLIERKYCKNITLVDVDYNQMCDLYPVTIYDGKKLPFKNNQFSKSLLIAVLHHSNNPAQLLKEAKRVTSEKIIIMEDIFTDLPSRIITFLGDCLVNFEIHSPFRNHTKEDWVKIFEKEGLKIEHIQEFKLWCVGFPFKLAIFIITK